MAYEGNGVYIWDADHNDYKNIGQAIGSVGPEGPASTVPGPPGEDGITPVISATASVDSNVGTPSVTVSKSGTDAAPSFDFAFHNLKGTSGQDGRDGQNGQDGEDGITPDITATATVDSNVGTPSVSIMKGGTDEEPTFQFNFSNLKGEPGQAGAASTVPGPSGSDGITPAISATASVDNNTGTPNVVITKTGTDAAPSFDFAFHNIKGADGANGQSIVGEQGPKGDPFTYADFTPAQLAALTGPSGSDGTRGSQIWRYDNMSMTEAQANTELWTNHRVQAILIRNIDGTMATDVLAGDWVINMKLKNLVRLTGHYGATDDWTTTDDDVIGLPAGATGPAGTITAWRVTTMLSGVSPAQRASVPDPSDWVDDCFYFYNYYGPNNATPKYGDFFYTAISNNVTTLGIVSGVGEDGHEPGVDYPYSFFTDCSQLVTAQGTPGTSAYHVQANFTPDGPYEFALSTAYPRTPVVGDVVYNLDNSYLANVSWVGSTTYQVSSVMSAVRKGDTGATGHSPVVSATATVGTSVGNPIVTVTNTGTTANPNFNFAFDGLKGLNGQNGSVPNLSMTAQVTSDNTAVPSVEVTKDDHDPLRPAFNLLFKNIDKNYYLCNTAIVANTAIPVNSLSRYGQSVAASMLKIGDVVYNNDKMAIIGNVNTTTNTFLVTGIATIKGNDGQNGISPTVSANATVDNNSGTPSVTVTNTGTAASPNFNFAFHNLKGRDGTNPDMTDYYTRDEVDRLLYNLKGGGGVVIKRDIITVPSNFLFNQQVGGQSFATCHMPIVTPPKNPAPWYVGKDFWIFPYYIDASFPNVTNLNIDNTYPANRTHVKAFRGSVYPELINSGIICKYSNGTSSGIMCMPKKGGTVEYGGRMSFTVDVDAFLNNYDEVLPVWRQKYGNGIVVYIKYAIVVFND